MEKAEYHGELELKLQKMKASDFIGKTIPLRNNLYNESEIVQHEIKDIAFKDDKLFIVFDAIEMEFFHNTLESLHAYIESFTATTKVKDILDEELKKSSIIGREIFFRDGIGVIKAIEVNYYGVKITLTDNSSFFVEEGFWDSKVR